MEEENMIRKQKTNELMTIEHLPQITESSLNEYEYTKYPIENLSALGVAIKPVVTAIQSIGAEGGSGFYYVDTAGKVMNKSGSKYIGSLKSAASSIDGQARMTKVPCDPTLLFMSMALMTIEQKLDDIKNLGQEILDFIKAQEKAELRANINTLNDILDNYKYNFDNDKYKTNKHILVQQIKKESEKSILLYRDLISSTINKKELFHSNQELDSKVKKLNENFREYKNSLYLYSYSTFLEIMLIENFNKDYISNANKKIEEYTYNYRTLYTDSYNTLEGISEKSIQKFLSQGIASIGQGTGNVIAKTPIINKTKFDELLINSSEKLKEHNTKRNTKSMKKLVNNSLIGSNPFIDSLNTVSKIHNDPIDILIDNNNLYLIEGKKDNTGLE